MPRNVRNFWIEGEVDGRKTPIAFGPQEKDGGFRLTVYMRDEGRMENVLEIEGQYMEVDDMITLWIDCKGEECIRLERYR